MKELIEYREKLIDRLHAAAAEFCSACRAVKDPGTKIEGDWSLHQIASHTRDVDKLVYGARVLQTLNEDNPKFKSFDADSWMSSHYDANESFEGILNEFMTNIESLCITLRQLPQGAWSRESGHETLGDGLTMQLWVERSLAHIEEHLRTVAAK